MLKPVIIIFLIFQAAGWADLREEIYAHRSAGQYQQMISKSEIYLKDNDDKEISNLAGRVLVDMGRYDEGIIYLDKAIELDNGSWVSGWSYGYLGQAYFMKGDLEKSRENLDKCIKLAATRNSVSYAKKRKMMFGFESYFDTWVTRETEHIRFHFQKPWGIWNIERYIRQREYAYEKLALLFGVKLPKKLDFYVWDNADQAYRDYGLRLGFAAPGLVATYQAKNQTIGHEMTHVFTHYIGDVKRKTAMVNEGVAVCCNMAAHNNLRKVLNYKRSNGIEKIDIRDVWINWGNYPSSLTYPLAGEFIKDLIKYEGIEKLKLLLLDQTYQNAQKIYGQRLDEIINRLEARINQEQGN